MPRAKGSWVLQNVANHHGLLPRHSTVGTSCLLIFSKVSRTKLLRYRFDGVLGRLCGFIACRNGSQGSDHSLELVRLNLRHSQMIAAPVHCTVVILMSQFSIIRSSDGVPGSTARRTTNIQALKNRLCERGGRCGGRGMSCRGSGRHSGPNSESVCSSCHLLLWT